MGILSRFRRKEEAGPSVQDIVKAALDKQAVDLLAQATDKAKELLLQDPVFHQAYQAKLQWDQHQRELDQVLNLGLTERVIRRLYEEVESRKIGTVIKFPIHDLGGGNFSGGEEIFINPVDPYEAMKRRMNGAPPWSD